MYNLETLNKYFKFANKRNPVEIVLVYLEIIIIFATVFYTATHGLYPFIANLTDQHQNFFLASGILAVIYLTININRYNSKSKHVAQLIIIAVVFIFLVRVNTPAPTLTELANYLQNIGAIFPLIILFWLIQAEAFKRKVLKSLNQVQSKNALIHLYIENQIIKNNKIYFQNLPCIGRYKTQLQSLILNYTPKQSPTSPSLQNTPNKLSIRLIQHNPQVLSIMLYFAAIEILQDRFITGSLIILIVIVLKLTKKYIKPNKLFQKNWDKILIIKKTMNIDNQSITLTDGPTIPLKDISDIKVRRRKLQVIFHDKLKKPINIPYIKLSYDPTLIREIILRKIYDLQY